MGRYAFIQDVFGFIYGGYTTGSGVAFPTGLTHYITERHQPGETIGTGSMTLPGVTLPAGVTALAATGTQPFLAVTTYGTGHAVQWGSYDWMSYSVKGPVYGLDDLVWRSLAWAARKPFVMQGMPPFLTMRVDDETGPFDYIHIANEFGIKPWAGLFVGDIDDTEAADLSALVNTGNASTAIHAGYGSGGWFYWAQSDTQIAANYVAGTNWHTSHNIPISKYVLPHYYQFGSNAFSGLDTWGVECVGTQMDPDQGYGAAWIMNGPYREYETGGSNSGLPMYYADYMTIPNHPEFDGRFFNLVTEIRDDAGYEWAPSASDVLGTIGRGTRQTRRALDSMALATLFTHAYYVHPFTAENWRTTLQGITNNLAPYHPINVTMDYACQYVISKYNSKITSSTYNTATRQLTTDLSGTTKIGTKFFLFMDDSGGIRELWVDVPQFSGSTQVSFTLPGPIARIEVTPNPGSVVAGASLQFTATGYDADNIPIPNLNFTWSVVNGGGTIDQTGRFTAGVVPNTYANTVSASFGSITSAATAVVTEPIIDHFQFDTITSPKYVGAPFSVTIRARDTANNLVLGYVGNVSLSASTGTVSPTSVGPFSGGVWSGPVTIEMATSNVTLIAEDGGVSGTSNAFAVQAAPTCPCSIWDSSASPSNPHNPDAQAVELGVKFRSATDGYITALRFYRGASNTGTTFVGHLWTASGTQLAEATFPTGTPDGWQDVALATPVAISADTTYIASYHTSSGYAVNTAYFTEANRSAFERPPLRALVNGEAGGNGVYNYGPSGSFPSNSVGSNYWVDVVFTTSTGPDTTPPTVVSVTPAESSTRVRVTSDVTATFSEAMASATINGYTFELRDGAGILVAASVTYNAGTRTARLLPAASLAYSTTYTVRVFGAGGVTDTAGNFMGADYSWSFTTAAEPPTGATSPRLDALVLVNSASPNYADFQHYIQLYLNNFGVPYTVLDIRYEPLPTDIVNYSLVIIGHRQLDPTNTYLDAYEQADLSAAVNAGTGLVNFDNSLWGAGGVSLYPFVQDVFGFGYVNATSGSGVTFPVGTTHYITARHQEGESISTGGMTLAGITMPADVTALATTGSQPFLAVTMYGQGNAVQWGSYNWMSPSVKGPIMGLDDLVWRSIIWAARKPFAMQSMLPFVTMRVDDEGGPFNYIHVANEFGIKPWAGLFYQSVSDANAADLSALVNSGNATATVHAKSGEFFYFDHSAGGNFPDATITANYTNATAWFQARNIPLAKWVLPHFYEFGSNVFQGLKDWGVSLVGTMEDPGLPYGAPWIKNGPYREFEAGGGGIYYAGFMTIPGHPDLDGQFFNCVTEIRDDAGYEWSPVASDVPVTIGRGTRQTKRALDSLALATLFTHAYNVHPFTMDNWRAALQGITNNLAPYNPIYTTIDYACQYARAIHTSNITAATYDPVTKQIVTTFTGKTDMPTKFYLYVDEGSSIREILLDVPPFDGSAVVNFTVPEQLDHITVTPSSPNVAAGGTQQFSAAGYDVNGNPIPNITFTWSVLHGGGTINNAGLFTAGTVPGPYADTVTASFGGVQGTASVNIIIPPVHHFTFQTIASPKYAGLPFQVTITARDSSGNAIIGYSGPANLSSSTGSITPSVTGSFTNGVWSGQVTIANPGTGISIATNDGGATGTSNSFDIAASVSSPCSIWSPGVTVGGQSGDTGALEVGVKFRADTNGYIAGIRFYKHTLNTSSHTGNLWTSGGINLGSLTFTSETGSGWQTAYFANPVPIQSDTTYVASYHMTGGHYAQSTGYFTSQGIDNPPIHALRSGVDGPNGVYVYDPPVGTGGVPNLSYQDSNYWVDVVFTTSATVHHFTFDAISSPRYAGAPFNVTITARDANGNVAPWYQGQANLSDTTGTLSPVQTGTFVGGIWSGAVTIPVQAIGVSMRATDGALTGTSNNFNVAAPPSTVTIWGPEVTGGPDSGDPGAVELGVKFRSNTQGFITAIRFYKNSANYGTHTGNLWTTSGTNLGRVIFSGETASGWQEATFAAPILIQANTTYIASYHTTSGHYARTQNYFTSSGVDNPPLHLLRTGVDGPNGVYRYSSTTMFPNLSYADTNYWVDVVFMSNRAPIAVDNNYPTSEDTTLNIAAPGVLANDTDPDSDPLTAILVNGTTNGTLSLNGDGSFIYTPNANYSGPDSFTYKANDGKADSNVVTVSITVSPVNDPPVANNLSLVRMRIRPFPSI